MSEIQDIENTLEKTARRRRWQRGWRGFWQALFAGAALWLCVLAVYKLRPIPEATLIVSAAVAAALMPVGFLVCFWRGPTLIETARWVDERQHFEERLSTALEVAASPKAGTWRDLVLSDAAGRARNFDPRKFLPFHLPRIARWALLLLVLAVTLGFVPEYRSKAYLQKKKETEIIKDTGKQLAELTRRSLERRPPALEPTQKALDSVKELGGKLARVSLTRTEALRDLASATEKLKDQTKDLAKDPALRKLEQAARSPTGRSASANADLQKQIDSLQKQLGNPNATPDALDKLQKELQKLQQAAAGLPGNDSASQQQKEQMSQSLSDLAKKAQELGLSLPSLEEAIKALQNSQIDQFLKDLKVAEIDLEKMQAMAKALQQLEMQQSKPGQDLAEQLDKGQAETALQTLQKMIDQLKKGNLTEDQLKKILEETDKAVKPGSQYGKVGDFLKAAAGKMQNSDKPGAAKSLADASDELKRLLDQLGDAQSLMASLDALQKAQMCIGNCMGWGQCQAKIPRVGKGGRPGRGVGTWSDDNGWIAYAEMTERWDNSGLQRPDMAPRGVSDRGDGELSDALVPTKVKGQISPGGPMPSITLKGVSIKGQSKVAYTEAVTKAQSEAQSALSQEQVPRAYQGAVKDYFDDLKE
ncbi:MAG: hypothetical protein DME19_19540 [Verrucomicrobia bacterium]|nr:MAG: hypothetical protein DME19_19540 [Verrucomicrobiota bacterium]